ncbi:hypothetical protein P43SY_007166 [Pythium insidiosum]|uniref:Uncharacterized protein n=1 Tax=Pythium insidiosum TaxID=114742 RepID=A0AAD5Q8B0_PYTIN|nr:hypothetical protein P43SY_007166 [Pythium insidiosum]
MNGGNPRATSFCPSVPTITIECDNDRGLSYSVCLVRPPVQIERLTELCARSLLGNPIQTLKFHPGISNITILTFDMLSRFLEIKDYIEDFFYFLESVDGKNQFRDNALLYHDSYLQNLERTQNVHESVSREMQHEVATFVAKYRQKYGPAGASSSTTTMRSCLRANEELLVGRGDPWSHASPSEGRSALDPAIDYSPSEKATLLVPVTQCIYWMFSQASTGQRRKR